MRELPDLRPQESDRILETPGIVLAMPVGAALNLANPDVVVALEQCLYRCLHVQIRSKDEQVRHPRMSGAKNRSTSAAFCQHLRRGCRSPGVTRAAPSSSLPKHNHCCPTKWAKSDGLNAPC
ncbi:MAG: hypothetical protein OXL38_06055, partial [Gammaproteobacteria bacterium]|nr:hypothetical protein [Gammaproteobacteria bacterium]